MMNSNPEIIDQGFENGETLDRGEASEINEVGTSNETTAPHSTEVVVRNLEKPSHTENKPDYQNELNHLYHEKLLGIYKQYQKQPLPYSESFAFNGRLGETRRGVMDWLIAKIGEIEASADDENFKKVTAEVQDVLGDVVSLNSSTDNESFMNQKAFLVAYCQELFLQFSTEQMVADLAFKREQFINKKNEIVRQSEELGTNVTNLEKIKQESADFVNTLNDFSTYFNQMSEIVSSYYSINHETQEHAIHDFLHNLLNEYIRTSGTTLEHRGQNDGEDPLALLCHEAQLIDDSKTAFANLDKAIDKEINSQHMTNSLYGIETSSTTVAAQQPQEIEGLGGDTTYEIEANAPHEETQIENNAFTGQVVDILDENEPTATESTPAQLNTPQSTGPQPTYFSAEDFAKSQGM